MRKIILPIIAILTMVSCNNDDSSSNSSCNSTIPFLQEGKILEYNIYQFGIHTGTLKYEIGSCNGDGFIVNRNSYQTNGTIYSSGTDLWKQDGDFLVTDSNNNGDYFSKIYKKGAQLGDSWTFTRPTDDAVITHEVVDMDSIITVPAGTFHCKVFKYTNTANINDSHIFWDDQIGNIMEDADGFFKIELKSHN